MSGQNNDGLKPCPFCGGPAEVTRTERSRTFGTTVLVGCSNPKCNAFSEPMAFAKSVWNSRPNEVPQFVAHTDPTVWDDMWAWIDTEWRFVRKANEVMGVTLIVEDYEHPGKLYTVDWGNCRRGDKPTEPPERHTQ